MTQPSPSSGEPRPRTCWWLLGASVLAMIAALWALMLVVHLLLPRPIVRVLERDVTPTRASAVVSAVNE